MAVPCSITSCCWLGSQPGPTTPTTSEERDAILHHLTTVEPLLRATATVEIDATAPIERVVQQLEELAEH
ncbi:MULTISPECIES: hypothetical protein [unclassified Streptomyces]|uniref:hypothetical protein n=1 Tax=unclassified Streptomyces TaxID=2593676 RepID=UPI00365CF6BA